MNASKSNSIRSQTQNGVTSQQQLSPIARKKTFNKSKIHQQPQILDFNPHLQKLNIQFYFRNQQIQPYSYTTVQNDVLNKIVLINQNQNQQAKRTPSVGSKMKSLKQISCIETVSQKSAKQSDSDQSSQLLMSKTLQFNEISSLISSPIEFKNFKSTFTLVHNFNKNQSQNKLLKSDEIFKPIPNLNKTNSVFVKPQTVANQSCCDKKTNKLTLTKRNSNNCSVQKNVVQVKIYPGVNIKTSPNQNKQHSPCINQRNVQESNIVFDYNKYFNKESASPNNKNQRQFHPINLNMFQFFKQQKQRTLPIQILNINSSNQSQRNIINLTNTQIIKNSNDICSSSLTQIMKQGPRSYSLGPGLKKLNGHKNQFNLLQKNNIKTETKTTTSRSSYLNHAQCLTPKQTSHIQLNTKPNLNAFIDSKQNYSNANYIKFNDHQRSTDNSNRQKNIITRNNHAIKYSINASGFPWSFNQKNSLQKFQAHGNQNRRRKSSKGITVSSKEKCTNVINNATTNALKVCVANTKIKSLNQIKNMKKLRLRSPDRKQTFPLSHMTNL